MKGLLFILALFFINHFTAQTHFEFCFDQPENCVPLTGGMPNPGFYLTIDTVANPNNVWHIGAPQKSILDSAQSFPNVIITDSINSYPVSDTSTFIITTPPTTSASNSVLWSNFEFGFHYFVDSDSLTDFGTVEFSPDNGATWIDLFNDPVYAQYIDWQVGFLGENPVLTGTSGEWKEARSFLHPLASILDIQPGSILLWRFTFISDAIQSNKDGLMFDNIFMLTSPPIGLEENELNSKKELVKIVDLLGRDIEFIPNTTLLYIYSDGTTEKVFKAEE